MTAKTKFKDTIITNLGRKLLIKAGAGESMIQYVRAGIFTQNVNGMDDYDIRNITALTGQQMDTPIKSVSDIVNNNITVSASFNNKANTDDLEFNTVGWFAKMSVDNKETLLGITPTNGTLTLAGHSPDNISTESINIDLNMAISNSAKVDMKVNEIGVVYKQDLDAELTKVKDGTDKKIANYYTKSDIDKNHYTRGEIDGKLASLGDVKTVNGVKPDNKGNVQINVDASSQINNITYNKQTIDNKVNSKANASEVYTKHDVDTRLNGKANSGDVTNWLNGKADKSNTYTKQEVDSRLNGKADKSNTYTKPEVDAKFVPINNRENDFENRIKYLEQNAMIGRSFNDENQAKEFSKVA